MSHLWYFIAFLASILSRPVSLLSSPGRLICSFNCVEKEECRNWEGGICFFSGLAI